MPILTHEGQSRRVAAAATFVVAVVVLAGCSDSPSSAKQSSSVPGATGATAATTADAAKLTAAVDSFFKQSYAPGKNNIRAVLVSVGGKPVVQRYYGASSASETADVRSVTKSVISTLVGIALSEGRLKSLDETLKQMLPRAAERMTPQVASITLRQLLTMTSGLPPDRDNEPDPSMGGADWVRNILARGTVQAPGTGFAYSSATSHLLAAILVQATGQPLLEYARDKLFDPLGIKTTPAVQPPFTPAGARVYDRAVFAWPVDPQGINTGFCCLKLTAMDSLALGNLFLAGGTWQGQRIVPASWVAEATSAKVSTGIGPGDHYGYQWWITSAGHHDAYAAVGFGGQIIEVVPDLALVVVASSNVPELNQLDASLFELMTTSALLPAME